MNRNENSFLKRITDKFYGGLNMSWPVVILFAVGTAVITTIFLVVPVFEGTSFERMGITFEAWIFFAIIIMANCEKPLESAAKTFVFFLISQPLIYLFQVPFSHMGWGLFGYYKTWFIWTLFTFPMAYIGWYIKKKNWLSLLILAPILLILTINYISGFQDAFRHFPRMIVMAVFCLAQVLIYIYVFTENIWQKLVGFIFTLVPVVILMFIRPQIDMNSTQFLPDNPVLTENAVIEAEEDENFSVSIESTGKDSLVRIRVKKYGTKSFVIRDGDKEYRYIVEVYDDDKGINRISITPEE